MSKLYDKNNRPIYPGDLLRSYHFTGARKKKYWLYHVAVKEGDRLRAVPAQALEPSKAGQGGDPLISEEMAREFEIIAGYGPEPHIDFEDRPRKPKPTL